MFSASFRCGIFFAGDKLNDKPREVLFIIPKRFPMDCATVKQEDVKAFCLNLVTFTFEIRYDVILLVKKEIVISL